MTFTVKISGSPSGLIIAEYRCPDCGVFESLVSRPPPDDMPCDECGETSPWCMSAPRPKVLSVPCYATVRGGDTERRPNMLDTRPLAEGMKMADWKKIQRDATRKRRHQKLVDAGIRKKRIQVG